MFYANFLQLCNNAQKSPSAVVAEMGLTKSAVTSWKRGSQPTDATLQKIAHYFSVPVTELTGEQEEPTPENGDGLSKLDQRLNDLLNRASDETKQAMIALLESLQKP